ncbi:hypothetical protein [Bradyrhizobium paxllaeri]|uniref:hypothetical protein n=1 Tax=Bradyrhizobium paxllaeri TaxID=190148 RepID=UPI0008105A74|nr:hypothetical protein [Bradyrhizobium paxllaeri]
MAAFSIDILVYEFALATRNRARADFDSAEAVAIVAIERLVVDKSIGRLMPTIAVLVECSAAIVDRKEALGILARRLENLAFVASPALLPEGLDTFRAIQSFNEDLAPLLGRAIATARLGVPSGTAG